MKKLRNYIKETKKITVSKAASEIGVSRQTLYVALRGDPVGRCAAKKIERWSTKAISAVELMQI